MSLDHFSTAAILRNLALSLGLLGFAAGGAAMANERLPWGQADDQPEVITPGLSRGDYGAQTNDSEDYGDSRGGYGPSAPGSDAYGYGTQHNLPHRPGYPPADDSQPSYTQPYQPGYQSQNPPYGEPTYGQPPMGGDNDPGYRPPAPVYPQTAAAPQYGQGNDGTYSTGEIRDAGHRFFGRISEGMANVIEYAFQRAGQPNGYILGEDAGGAFVAGLRYGEGTLYTKDAGIHKVYWQGPSIGYDFGAEGSKTMILVYNLRHPDEIYQTFGGVAGAAYLVGGVGITFQQRDDLILAPIRSGVGLRLGANLGYLKYTREPTWNPF